MDAFILEKIPGSEKTGMTGYLAQQDLFDLVRPRVVLPCTGQLRLIRFLRSRAPLPCDTELYGRTDPRLGERRTSSPALAQRSTGSSMAKKRLGGEMDVYARTSGSLVSPVARLRLEAM